MNFIARRCRTVGSRMRFSPPVILANDQILQHIFISWKRNVGPGNRIGNGLGMPGRPFRPRKREEQSRISVGRRVRKLYGSLKSPLCSCVSITLQRDRKRELRPHVNGCKTSRSRRRCWLRLARRTTADRMGARPRLNQRCDDLCGAGLHKRPFSVPILTGGTVKTILMMA
jgi:hypothetical protein